MTNPPSMTNPTPISTPSPTTLSVAMNLIDKCCATIEVIFKDLDERDKEDILDALADFSTELKSVAEDLLAKRQKILALLNSLPS